MRLMGVARWCRRVALAQRATGGRGFPAIPRRGDGEPQKATAALRPPPLPSVARDLRSGAIELGRSVTGHFESDLFLDHVRLMPFELHGIPPGVFQVLRDWSLEMDPSGIEPLRLSL